MKHLPAPVLKILKDKLMRLRDDASNETCIAESRSLQSLDTKDGEAQDRAERAEAWREAEIDKAEIAIDHATVRAADMALQRIADGNYGVCQDCGRAIARARLLALPIALRCAACQQAYEQCHGR
ncbi:RNA polymerase-binding transcription factor DksA [Castellaniella defragrans]